MSVGSGSGYGAGELCAALLQGRIQEIFKGGAIPNRGPHVCGALPTPIFLSPDFAHLIFSGPPFSFCCRKMKKMKKFNKGPLGAF